MPRIVAHLTKGRTIHATLARGQTILGSIDKATVSPPSYQGDYAVTPSNVAQTLQTKGMLMSGDLKVNPIPSNYGRIAYSGSGLLVY